VKVARPLVHIGFPKTATTWFQRSFYPHVRNLPYLDRAGVNAALLEGNAFAFDPAEARKILGLEEGGAGILCEEGLSGYLHNGGMLGFASMAIAERIRSTLPDARIVIFLRSQPKMIAAAYQQYVRGGGTHGPHRFVFPQDYLIGSNAQAYKQPRFDIEHFLYSRMIGHYEALFEPENVHVFLFEQLGAEGAAFLRRYADALGLEVDWPAVSMAPRLPSYGLPLTRLARFLNLFTARSVLDKHHVVHVPGWYALRRRILETLNRTRLLGAPPSPERLFGVDTVRWLEDFYAGDNRRVAEARGLPLETHGYPVRVAGGHPRPHAPRWRKWLAR